MEKEVTLKLEQDVIAKLDKVRHDYGMSRNDIISLLVIREFARNNGDEEKESENYKEWKRVCEVYCERVGWKLLFVNSDNFGAITDKNDFAHIYADELAEMLRKEKE